MTHKKKNHYFVCQFKIFQNKLCGSSFQIKTEKIKEKRKKNKKIKFKINLNNFCELMLMLK